MYSLYCTVLYMRNSLIKDAQLCFLFFLTKENKSPRYVILAAHCGVYFTIPTQIFNPMVAQKEWNKPISKNKPNFATQKRIKQNLITNKHHISCRSTAFVDDDLAATIWLPCPRQTMYPFTSSSFVFLFFLSEPSLRKNGCIWNFLAGSHTAPVSCHANAGGSPKTGDPCALILAFQKGRLKFFSFPLGPFESISL